MILCSWWQDAEVDIAPWIGGFLAFAGLLYLSFAGSFVGKPLSKYVWIVPGLLSCLFAALSVRAIAREGALGFWAEHTRNLWGNQIWFDLLLGVSAAISMMLPRARQVEMRVVPWVLFCLASGSIGLYAFISRLLFLESQRASR